MFPSPTFGDINSPRAPTIQALQSSPVKVSTNTSGNSIYTEAFAEHDARLAQEGHWLLERSTVYEPYEFLRANFPPDILAKVAASFPDLELKDDVPLAATDEQNVNKKWSEPLKSYIKSFTDLKSTIWKKEKDMYPMLVSVSHPLLPPSLRAFNAVLNSYNLNIATIHQPVSQRLPLPMLQRF